MKKFLIASGVAVLAFATVAAAATFNNNLTVGSRGADVVALQAALKAAGFSIPAIDSGAAQPGYFGTQTQAAVKLYQASRVPPIPNTGFVGPLTRGALNGGGSAMASNCATGWTSASYMGTSYCVPPGMQLPAGSQTVTPPVSTGPFVMDGTDGSLTLSTNSYVSSTQTLKKGDVNKPILALTGHATNGNVHVTRFDVHFNARPWLLFSRLTLKNPVTGQVLATKNLSTFADVTEVTVGSDYLVRFDNVNSVATAGTDTTYVVYADVQAASDKITGQTVTVSIDGNAIRTINGKGYTDSIGLTTISNSIVLSQTGSTGDLLTRVGLTTPDTRTDNISTTNVTENINLGVFDVKLQNQGGVLNTINFQVNVSTTSYAGVHTAFWASNVFQNFRLYRGSELLAGAYSVSGTAAVPVNPATVVFTNMNIKVNQDEWVPLTLKADALASSTAISASSTIVASSVVGSDNNYATVTLTNASNRTANNVTLVPNAGVTLTSHGFTKRTPSQFNTSAQWLTSYPTYTFTINNTGNNPIYISKTASVALATSTSAGPNASTTVSADTITASGSTSGDTSTSYIINASRTFTVDMTTDNTNFAQSSKKISVTQINYGTAGGSGTDNTLNINYGLESDYINLP
ncbi:MAG: putative peptidoglycan binding domain [Candidatus Parcubacteria bacterium]|jgi:hypothetical protein